jgi:hypothetical protein
MFPHQEGPHFWVEIDATLDAYAQREVVHSARQMGPLLDALDACMQQMVYPRKDIFAVKLAVHEAGTSAFRQGGGDANRSVHFRYLVAPEEVLIEMQYEGCAFAPSHVPVPVDECGLGLPRCRGLYFMRALMTWLRFNPEGNRVILCKNRSMG